MIDYLTCKIPCALPGPLYGGQTVSFDKAGKVEWASPRPVALPGSFESSLQVRAIDPQWLHISGNPTKWLQGHNLFGPDDVWQLVELTVARVLSLLPDGPLTVEQAGVRLGGIEISRVDVNYMFQLGSLSEVLAWLRSASQNGHCGRLGRAVPTTREGTVTFGGKGSTRARWLLKIYSKGQETTAREKGHRLPDAMNEDPEVRDWVNRCLRVEVRFGRLELEKQGKRLLSGWRPGAPVIDGWCRSDAAKLWEAKVAQLDFNGQVDVHSDMEKLPRKLRSIFAAWKSGHDVRMMCSQATFYRHRKDILALVGVDIAVPPPAVPMADIVPLRRVLEARPVGRPLWADRMEALLAEQGCIALSGAA